MDWQAVVGVTEESEFGGRGEEGFDEGCWVGLALGVVGGKGGEGDVLWPWRQASWMAYFDLCSSMLGALSWG